MTKESLQIAEQFAKERKRRGTQQDAARLAGLSVPTIRQLERGRGRLTSFWRALDTFDIELAGRNLPAGTSPGHRLALLRKRRGLSQRALASLAGISPPTVTALERSGRGRLETLDTVLSLLGAGAYLMPRGQKQAFYTHAGNSSIDLCWTTPKSLLHRLYAVFGTFDLDPCSPTANGRYAPVQARMYFTEDDDGLSLPWLGQVFVNPPYGRQLSQWIEKARTEVQEGRALNATVLVPARTDTKWWHNYIAGSAYVILLKGRLSFGQGGQTAPFPSALVIWGAGPDLVNQLEAAFPEAWHIPPEILY